MKRILSISILCLFLLNFISASVQNDELQRTWGIKEGDVLKSYYKEINISLFKDKISYEEVHKLLFSDNLGEYVLFLLPEGKNYSSIVLYDLKGREDIILERDITKLNNCSNKYSVKRINDTETVLVCPNNNYDEVEIKISSLLYSQETPIACLENGFDYYLYFPEIYAVSERDTTKDFKIKFSLIADDSIKIIPNKYNGTNFCSKAGLNFYSMTQGFVCEGSPKIDENLTMFFNNISLAGINKEKEAGKSQFIYWLIGSVLVAFLIAMFQNQLSKIGDKIAEACYFIKNYLKKSNTLH